MLEILGIILLFIIVKFVYDTFLTNNTTETKEWHKEHYPEESYRLDRNEGLDFNVKPKVNINDRQRSIEEFAKNMNTTPELAQEKFIEKIQTEVNSHYEKTTFLKEIRNKKIEEAKIKGIDPDDSIAALMEKWAKEYLNSVDFHNHKSNSLDLDTPTSSTTELEKFLNSYPELKKLIENGTETMIMKYILENPDVGRKYFEFKQQS